MLSFKPHIMGNFEFYLDMCKDGRGPRYPTQCQGCRQPLYLVKNRLCCKTSTCLKSYDIWENTPLKGFPSIPLEPSLPSYL